MIHSPSSSSAKLLFFDIDGTLAVGRRIPEENIKALQQLKEKGHLTFICTGRPAFYPRELFGSLPSGYVCCNGCSIEADNQLLFEVPVPEEHLQKVKAIAREMNLGLLFSVSEGVIPFNFSKRQLKMAEDMYSRKHFLQDSPSSICTYDIFFDSIDQFEKVRDRLANEAILSPHFPHPRCDCSIKGWSKGEAMEWLQNYFGVSKENTYAFGDGINDLSMFEHADHKIAMGNAVSSLKNQASYITDAVDQKGVYNALVHYQLIEQDC